MYRSANSGCLWRRPRPARRALAWLAFFWACATPAVSQTVFLNFNAPGQYTGNFNPWNDNGIGVNGGVYSFEENTTNGVGGSGGVAVFQNNDTTATYKSGSWNLSTNGATVLVLVLIYADGQSSADKVQLGLINSTTNGLNGNPGVAFETFRFLPASAASWTLYEQYRTNNVTVNSALGTVTVAAGRWYKFVVGVTNTSGATGNLAAGCALFDYGTNGLTPGANVITFSTAVSHAAKNLATNTAVRPALRAFEDAGISAWDNFLVFQSNSLPVLTLPLANSVVTSGSAATFNVLADGPGTIAYAWYTNAILASGASGPSYTSLPVGAGFTNVAVVASNGNGSVTNSATVTVQPPATAVSFFENGSNWTINQSGLSSANITANVFHGTDGNGGEAVTAWYNNWVYINGFVAIFTYQDVGGSVGANADGASFALQTSGPGYLGAGGGSLAISGLTPSADWEINLYSPNGIGIIYNTDGATFGYQTTGAVNVSSGDPINFTIQYTPGGAVQETLVDTVTQQSYTTNFNIGDITALLGGSYAYIGFSSADGGVASTQTISNFGYQSGSNNFTLAVVTNLPATAIQPEAATLAGQVLATGGFPPTITLYYGPADGGTNAANWADSITLGVETGTFSQAITGLSPNTTWYYTVKAVNFAGTNWASPSLNFNTTSVSPPQVANAPATAIGATLATLNGRVLSTGGVPPAVTLYYGTNDGGPNAAAWSNSISLGSQSGLFAQTVGSLSSNTTYYFTAGAVNSAATAWATPSLNFTTLASNPVSMLTAVLTYHNDNTRMGVNSNETILTPANVNTNSFGRLFSCTLDGFVYAQPLIMTNVNIPGKGTHNVVYVATEHDSVYAFDADNNSGANASPLWQTSFLGPGVTNVPSGDTGTSDITPEIGITSTPVIDPVTGTIYLEVKTLEGGSTFVHRLHALDITTGLERTSFNSPVVIQCTNYPGNGGGDNDGGNPPHVLWNPLREHSRPALTLLNGVVYLSFASHGDNGPYHGWLFGYNATNVALPPSVFNSTPNGGLGGFWDGGGGPSVDAQGNLYFQTGNGDFNGTATLSTADNYSMSLLKFSTTNGLALADYFAPSNAVALSGGDQDLGSAAPIILPDSAGSTAHPHLVVGGGKTAPIYLVDRDNMGRFNGTTGNNLIVQQFNGSSGGDRDTTPAFFNNTLYVFDANSRIGAFTITNAVINTTPVETPDTYDNKGGATACISANGASNAIMWALYNSGADSPTTPCILRAYNATNLTQELYTSAQLAARDAAGDAVKFTAPTIANGKVYVGAQYSLTVYGLAEVFVSTPVISPNGGVYTNSVTVTLSDSTAGAAIYYTLDGTTPTTNSTPYTGPFVVTNSLAVTAGAFLAGAVASAPATASFINSSSIGNGTGLLGQYWTQTTSAAFTNANFNTPPTLTRIDTNINFNWGTGSPDPSISDTNFTARWTGSVVPQFNETYAFYTTTDDGTRLWVNGQLLVNEWVDQGATEWSGAIALKAQQRYNIRMDYYQNGGDASATLAWSSPSTTQAIIPESQLYPVTNPPPSVTLTAPTNGFTGTASASVTLSANAAAQFNSLTQVAFYTNGIFFASVSNPPYSATITGLAAGSYTITAAATDGSGLTNTSAPATITVNPGSGQPYGLTNVASAPAFYNMPPVFTGPLPAHLSLTGVFANTPAMTPAASLIPYAPNVPLWSDGAQKGRYFSVPNTGAPLTPGEQIAFAPTNTWSFPAGTVFVKTFELLTNQSDPTSLLRLETRLLVRDTNGAVYGVTYKWRADYSDADLLATNLTQAVPVLTPGGLTTNLWYYPSPSDCLQCHTPPANYVLGLNARQLNGTLTYSNGVTDNQLRALNRTGLFYPALDESRIPAIEQLSSLTNVAAAYVQRARSYLDANCAQCHQPGGSGPTFDARYDTPLAGQNILNGLLAKGNLGDPATRVVVSNDVWRSLLWVRMNTNLPTLAMPPLARNIIDTNAVQIVGDWINSLGGTPALAPPSITPAGGVFVNSASVTLQTNNAGAAIYYTLDGTLPTASSILYSAPFLVTSNLILTASAFAGGYINSFASAAQFAIQPLLFTSPGQFVNNQFILPVLGVSNTSYALQASTNLINWVPISTNLATTNSFTLADTNAAGFRYRFYRLLQLP
jgi:hypothetical protein